MILLEVQICGIDSLPKEMSEVYRLLNEIDPTAAEQSLYSVDVPLGREDP